MGGNLFSTDDTVRVLGYLGRQFRVMNVTNKDTYIYGVFHSGYLYKLIDTKTYEILDDVFEDDITLVKKFKPIHIPIKDIPEHETKWQEYEDYLTLYEMLGDEEYRDKAVKIYVGLVKNRNK